MSSDELISREEVLTGLPAKRANTLLFLIESRTAHLVARSRVEFSLTDSAANERALAFLEAFALGNAPPLRPTIQHLERYAPQWLALMPENPRLKAALIQVMSQKYNFTAQAVPNIWAVLGLDEQEVQEAYRRQYGKPLETVFASQLSLREQLRWGASAIAQRLEALPPFWIAFLITVALGLPQAFLALPIACASVGTLPTLVFLVTLGAINILTMVCMAEAISRSGDFRYGNAFIKQLATNYLGDAGSFILSFAVGIRVFFIALACYIGLSVTMANLTFIPASVWAVLLFGAGIYLILVQSLSFTVTVMIFLAAINVGLLLLLALLAFSHLQLENLLYLNLSFLNGGSFAPQMLHQVFGVILMLYFGHIYVGECAKLVLPRDPSGTSLIWGSVAGTAFLTFLFCLWVLAINGAISPQVLATQTGTALEPLAQHLGSFVKVLGAVLVTFLLGMAWLRSSSLLVNLTREWFPSKPHPILMLPCQQGRLILQPRGNSGSCLHLGLTYLGLALSQPKFRLDVQLNGNIHHLEITVSEYWEIKELFSLLPDLNKPGIELTLAVHSANPDRACLRVTSSLLIAYEGALETTANADNTLLNPKSRKVVSLSNKAVSDHTYARRAWGYLLEQRCFLLSISPLVLVLLLSELLFFTGTQSFTSIISFAGVLGNSLVGGIFPVLILVSSRRKGELVPGVAFPIFNHPLLLTALYSFFLAILFLHGMFIWESWLARTSAIFVTMLSLVATLMMVSTGAFTPRTVVEMRDEPGAEGRTYFNITAGGQPKIAEVCLVYSEGEQHYQAATVEIPSLSSLRSATFKLSTKRMEELKMWAHQGKPNGDFESLPALLEVQRGNKAMQFDLKLSGGKVLLPLISDQCFLRITLPELALDKT